MDDLLYYCNDILTLGVPQLAAHVSRILWTDLLEPLLLPAAARAAPFRAATTASAPQSTGLTRVPSLGRYVPLAHPLRVLPCARDTLGATPPSVYPAQKGGVINIGCCHNENNNNNNELHLSLVEQLRSLGFNNFTLTWTRSAYFLRLRRGLDADQPHAKLLGINRTSTRAQVPARAAGGVRPE